jgi:tagatose-6-phosphate ketose/aldose isomerase
MTSSFSSLALAALSIAHVRDIERLRPGVLALASTAERVLDETPRALRRLAALRLTGTCFLGSGALRAIAGEAALKLLELTAGRVTTLHESFLGVRHGPLAALNERTALLGFLSSEVSERAHELDLVEEVVAKRLAGRVVLVVPGEDERASALADEVLRLPDARKLPVSLRPLLDVIVAQVLALFASLEHGLLPDSPSPNGAIQRVVTELRQR